MRVVDLSFLGWGCCDDAHHFAAQTAGAGKAAGCRASQNARITQRSKLAQEPQRQRIQKRGLRDCRANGMSGPNLL